MRLRRAVLGATALLVVLSLGFGRASTETGRCSAPEELTRFRVALPNTARSW